MTPSPRLLMSLLMIMSLGLGLALFGQAFLWLRLRRLGLGRIDRLVEPMQNRLTALEELAAQSAAAGSGHEARLRSAAKRVHPRAPSLRSQGPAYRVDPAEANAVSGPTLISVPNLSSPAQGTDSVMVELGRRFGPIWDLADRGATPDAIARSTGQPIGQVELILALRRQLAAPAGESRPT